MRTGRQAALRKPTMAQRLGALACAGALACSAAAPAMAFADLPEGQTGSGKTDLIVKIDNSERGGTEQPKVVEAPDGTPADQLVDADGNADASGEYILNPYYNPDTDDPADGLGNNLAFTVPVQINYVAKATGELTAPSTYVENHSVMQVRVSSLDIDEKNSWKIVEDATADTTNDNAVDFTLGPDADELLRGSDYLDKTAISAHATDITKWNMGAHQAGTGDQVAITTSGHMNNVAKNIPDAGEKFGEVHWYFTPGNLTA